MKGDKITANFINCNKNNRKCVCINRETKDFYDLVSMTTDQLTDKKQFKFERVEDGQELIVSVDEVEDKFILLSDWNTFEAKIKNKVFPYFITNLCERYIKDSDGPFEGPATYFKFIQYVPGNTFIYECDYRNGKDKDCFMVHLDMDELYDVIEDPVKMATQLYNDRKTYLDW